MFHCSILTAQDIVSKERVVRGEWVIKRPVLVEEEGRLIIEPGASLLFEPEIGTVDKSMITVHGTILINGTKEDPVLLQAKGELGKFSALNIESDFESVILFAKFENFLCSLHMHFSPVIVEHCLFVGNTAGVKFRAGRVILQDNTFRNNYTAIRFWYSDPVIIKNKFLNNQTGIFVRGGVVSPIIAGNIFNNKKYDIKLSEDQEHDIDSSSNKWRSDNEDEIRRYIYDKKKTAYLGLVKILPVMKD